MNHPEIQCTACGGKMLRRSHTASPTDFLKMLFGNYPFRCAACHQRSWINVWLNSKYARCSHCLGTSVVLRTHAASRNRLWKRLLVEFGARRYRCLTCQHRFLSFRPSERADQVKFAADNLAVAR